MSDNLAIAMRTTEGYHREVQIDPNNYKAYFNLGVIFRRMNRNEDAIRSFEKVLSLNQQVYPVYYQLAETYLAANLKLEEGLRLLEIANKNSPSRQGQLLESAIKTRLKDK